MRIEHVIYLSSAGCALWSWRDGEFADTGLRTPIGVDPAPIAAALRAVPVAAIGVIVDMTDEEHLRETVPRLARRDQQAIVERKLARAFPRTLLRTALIQNRNLRDPSQNDVYLSGLTRPDPVNQLLQRLADAKLPVAGVYTPALLSENVLDVEARTADALLLVLRRANGRLQHSYFRYGRLAGSRRLRATAGPALTDPTVMVRQLEESLRYFDPTLNVSDERPLPVLLAQADLDLLTQSSALAEGWQLRPLAMPEVCRRLKIRAAVSATDSDRLFIELLRTRAPRTSFAPHGALRYHQIFEQRSYARAASLAVGVAAFALTATNGLHIWDAARATTAATHSAEQIAAVLPTADDTLSGVDPVEMQRAVNAYAAIEAHQAEPAGILAAVGAALSQRPRIQLDAVRWSTAAALSAEAATAEGEQVDAEALEAAAPPDPRGYAVTLSGRVSPFAGDYLDAFDEIDALVAALAEEPDVETVQVTSKPMDDSPSGSFNGELSRDNPTPVEAPFTLEIRMRVPDEQA